MHKTKKNIVFVYGIGKAAVIPKGTKCIPADNLPDDNSSNIHFWVEPWPKMTRREKDHMRLVGFGLSKDDVKNI